MTNPLLKIANLHSLDRNQNEGKDTDQSLYQQIVCPPTEQMRYQTLDEICKQIVKKGQQQRSPLSACDDQMQSCFERIEKCLRLFTSQLSCCSNCCTASARKHKRAGRPALARGNQSAIANIARSQTKTKKQRQCLACSKAGRNGYGHRVTTCPYEKPIGKVGYNRCNLVLKLNKQSRCFWNSGGNRR